MNRKGLFSGLLWTLALITLITWPLLGQVVIEEREGGGGMPPLFEATEPAPDVDLSTEVSQTLDQAEAEELERVRIEDGLEPRHCVPLPGGLDHVANGTGARNAGHGTIRLRGAPATAVAVRAILYWGEIVSQLSVPATDTINFEGHPVTGSLIGTAGQPCWNGAGIFAAYRADVLQYLPGAIDGDYQVDGLSSAVIDGHDPWVPADTRLPMAQGASLVVIYADQSVPATSRVYIHEGPWLFTSNNLFLTHALAPALPGNALLRHTRIGGDGQVGGSVSPTFATSRENTSINALQIQGPGSVGNDSDWNGSDGGPLNQLWDTRTTNAPGSIPVGAAAYRVSYTNVFDCVNPVVHVLTGR